jgi:DNA polymerase-3 subunit gamma/tau
MVCKDPQTIELLQVGKTISDKYRDQSKLLEVDILLYALKITAKCDVQFKMSQNKRLLVELCLMQLCSIKEAVEKKKA